MHICISKFILPTDESKHVYVYIRIYVYMHMCIYVYMYVCINIYLCIYVYISIYIDIDIDIDIYACMHIKYVCMYAYQTHPAY